LGETCTARRFYNQSDIVIGPFLGSGSTPIAAEATGRVCRGVYLDPLYVDVIIRQYQGPTGSIAVTFDTLAARRAAEARLAGIRRPGSTASKRRDFANR